MPKLDYLSFRKTIKLTTGNLSRQLQILERADYVAIEKRFKGKYPETICGMTRKGREALALYAEMLKQVTEMTEGAKKD